MKSYTVIMAHKEAATQLALHMPFHRQNTEGSPILIFCPSDSNLYVNGCEHLFSGRCGHHGAHAIERFRFLLNHLKDRCAGYDRLIIHEWDSICVSPRFPDTRMDAVSANAFYNREPSETYREKMYTHPPLAIPMALMPRICEAMAKLPNDSCGGMWDRFFGLALEMAGIEIVSFCEHTGDGFSMNTIEPEHYPRLHKSVMNDAARVFHGVKNQTVLDIIKISTPWILHSTAPKRNYISFSLWGDSPKYVEGMARNIELAERFYPGWVIRIYMPAGERSGEAFKRFARYVKFVPDGIPPMMARFLIHDSPDCDRFIIRDADSRLSAREAAAVREWIASGRNLHSQRDHPAHSSFPICGGMWGGVSGKLVRSMEGAIRSWLQNHAAQYEGHDPDQRFLADVIYPACKQSRLEHDTFSRKFYPGSIPFPTERPHKILNRDWAVVLELPKGIPYFVGEVFDAEDNFRTGDREMILAAEGLTKIR